MQCSTLPTFEHHSESAWKFVFFSLFLLNKYSITSSKLDTMYIKYHAKYGFERNYFTPKLLEVGTKFAPNSQVET